ncbi:uncharacterized protein HGUI_03280 [Hanseniaspora guilliermondii]|uniref:Stress response protein NST1 n=1 Tax=Hanseniaspora guilliermondii TaxID=56406 RepID=A0A1L0B3L4_9ASCO|nr:uncharacterized protein HGUI_03280 [Hanseniaspora guilliermondii]
MAKHKKHTNKVKSNNNDDNHDNNSSKSSNNKLSTANTYSEPFLNNLTLDKKGTMTSFLHLSESISRYLNDSNDDNASSNNRTPEKFDKNDMYFFNELYMSTMNNNLQNQESLSNNAKLVDVKLSNVSSYSKLLPQQQYFFEAITKSAPLDNVSLVILEAFQRVFYELYEMSKYHDDIVQLTSYWRLYLLLKKRNIFYSLLTNLITYLINKGWDSYEILKKITSMLNLSPSLKKELSNTYKGIVDDPEDFGLRIYTQKQNNSKSFNAEEFNPANNKCFLLTLIDLTPILYEPHGIKLLCYYPRYSLIMKSQKWTYEEITEFSAKQIGIPKHERLFENAEYQFDSVNNILENNMKKNNSLPKKIQEEDNDQDKVVATIKGKKITQKTLDSRAMTLKNTYKELSKEEREKLLNITREDVFRVFSRSEIKGQISSSEMSGFHAFAKKTTEKIGDEYNTDSCDCCSGGKHYDYEVNGKKIYETLFKSEKMKDEDLTDAEFNLRILNDEAFITKRQKTNEANKRSLENDDQNPPSYSNSSRSSILSDIFVNSAQDEDISKVETETVSSAIQNISSLSTTPPAFKEEQYKKLTATENIANWLTENTLIKSFLKRSFRLLPMVEIADNIMKSNIYERECGKSPYLFSIELDNGIEAVYNQDGEPCSESTLQDEEEDENMNDSKLNSFNDGFSVDSFYETLKNNISLENFDRIMDKTCVEDPTMMDKDVFDVNHNSLSKPNVGYTNLKSLSEIVWNDDSYTIQDPNIYMGNQYFSISSKLNDVKIDFETFNKHIDEFKEILHNENKKEYQLDIQEIKDYVNDVENIQDEQAVDEFFDVVKQLLFKGKDYSIIYESFMNDPIEDDLKEFVISEEEKKLPTVLLNSLLKPTPPTTMLKDLYLSKGFDDDAKFDVKAATHDGIETHFFTFTNSYKGKRLFIHKNFHTNHVNGLMKRYSNSGLITDESLENLHKNTSMIINSQTGILDSDCLYTYKSKKLQMLRERSFENCDYLDSDDEDDFMNSYDENATKEKIFNNCITMIRSAVKIALREKLEHATKEIEVEKNRLLLLKQLEEEENRESQKTKKSKKKEKNKKKQQQKEEKEAKKLEEQKKKEEEERLKKERDEKEMKRREEQRKKAEEMKRKKDEQLRRKREEQAKRDEIEAKARKLKEEQKKLKEEQRRLKEEEKKKKQLEKKKKQEMKEAEEEMKRKLEINNPNTAKASVDTDSLPKDNEHFSKKPSMMNTPNVQPYISLLDSLQGNNQEGADLLNMRGHELDKEEVVNPGPMGFNSSYVMNGPPGLGMSDFNTPSPMMTSGFNVQNNVPSTNTMLYPQGSPANTMGSMYGSIYNQQGYAGGSSGYGMYGSVMPQMNEGENMNYRKPSVWNNGGQQGPFSSTMMSLAGGGLLNSNMNSYYNSLMGVYGNNKTTKNESPQQ